MPAVYGRIVITVHLRAVRAEDLPALSAYSPADDPFGFFGHHASNLFDRRFAENGMISDDHGSLAAVNDGGELLGTVGWFAVRYGPASSARALNIGIYLLPAHRGRGYGTAAQDAMARYLFDTTLIERLEAATDVENIGEQRALEKAGFQREGIVRHTQFRAGSWHDMVLYSRLRGD